MYDSSDSSQGELPFPLRCFAAIPLIHAFANPQAGRTLTGFAILQAVSGSGSARLSRTALLGEFPNPEDRTLRGYAFFSKC